MKNKIIKRKFSVLIGILILNTIFSAANPENNLNEISFIANQEIEDRDIHYEPKTSQGSIFLLWEENGNEICGASDDQRSPKIISDGAGGAIIAWEDHRSGTSDIYAQHIDSSGAVLWE